MKTKLILALICLPLCGCETLRTWQANPNVQFAELEALKLTASFFNNGGNSSTAWGISQGLNVLGDYATFKTQTTAEVAANAKAQVKAFADDHTAVNGLAMGVANIVVAAAPKTATEKALIVQAIASGIQQGASAIAKP